MSAKAVSDREHCLHDGEHLLQVYADEHAE
jgi:hypothetical protein